MSFEEVLDICINVFLIFVQKMEKESPKRLGDIDLLKTFI